MAGRRMDSIATGAVSKTRSDRPVQCGRRARLFRTSAKERYVKSCTKNAEPVERNGTQRVPVPRSSEYPAFRRDH